MKKSVDDIREGQVFTEVLVDNLTRGLIVGYAIAVGDVAAEHTDEIYCTQAAGLPSVFGHGMFTVGMTARMLTNWAGAGSIRSLTFRFRPTRAWPGDKLSTVATVESLDKELREAVVGFVTKNDMDEALLSGRARLSLAA